MFGDVLAASDADLALSGALAFAIYGARLTDAGLLTGDNIGPLIAIIGFIASWGRDGGPNFQGSSDAEIDGACRSWEIAHDDEGLRAAAVEIQLRAAETLPLIPLFSPSAVWAHHRRVRNWRPNRHDLYPLYADVWLADE